VTVKYKLQCTAWNSTIAQIKYFIHQVAKIFISVITTRKSTIFAKFCNPKILELECRQSQDSGLAKNSRDPGIGIAITRADGTDLVILTCAILIQCQGVTSKQKNRWMDGQMPLQ